MTAKLKQGYSPLYRPGTVCPGCGAGHWHIGRLSAECDHCHTALPLAPPDHATAPPERHAPAWTYRP